MKVEDEEHYEVEKILDHKKDGNSFKYLVKWTGYDDAYNTWETEDKFDSAETIANYWKTVHQSDKARVNLVKPNVGIFTMLAFMFALLIVDVSANEKMTIKQQFKFCDATSHPIIFDWSQSCQYKKSNKKFSIFPQAGDVTTYTSKDTHVLNKLQHTVHGTGYQCKKESITVKYSKSFFGVEVPQEIKQLVKLTKQDCEVMVLTKKCGEKSMECDGGICSYSPTFQPEYKWMQEITKTDYSCVFFPRVITALDVNSPLFGTTCTSSQRILQPS